MTGLLSRTQVDRLLAPVNPSRVAQDQGGHSHLPQQDVRAHLTRIFGFGNWSMHVVESSLVFEEAVTWTKNGTTKSGYDVCYRATVRLSIRDRAGEPVAEYEDTSTGDAQHQTRLAGHDLALKSAVSTALKRAATCLGDQFGLSLYNRGSLAPFVLGTLVYPDEYLEDTQAPTLPAELPGADLDEQGPHDADGHDGDGASNDHADEEPGEDEPVVDVDAEAERQRKYEAQQAEKAANAEKARKAHNLQDDPMKAARQRAWTAGCKRYPNWTNQELTDELALQLRNLDQSIQTASVDHWLAIAEDLEAGQ